MKDNDLLVHLEVYLNNNVGSDFFWSRVLNLNLASLPNHRPYQSCAKSTCGVSIGSVLTRYDISVVQNSRSREILYAQMHAVNNNNHPLTTHSFFFISSSACFTLTTFLYRKTVPRTVRCTALVNRYSAKAYSL